MDIVSIAKTQHKGTIMSQNIQNPMQAQADVSAENALKDKVHGIISDRIRVLLPSLAADFSVALREHREPTPEEVATAIETRGGGEPTAFSNDNDGKAWYVKERLLPLITVMNNGITTKITKADKGEILEDKLKDIKSEQIGALRKHLFDQEFIKHLDTKKADEYLATKVEDLW